MSAGDANAEEKFGKRVKFRLNDDSIFVAIWSEPGPLFSIRYVRFSFCACCELERVVTDVERSGCRLFGCVDPAKVPWVMREPHAALAAGVSDSVGRRVVWLSRVMASGAFR